MLTEAYDSHAPSQMTIRLTIFVDSPSRRAHGNAASRLAIGLAESGRVQPTLLCYGSDPAPEWLDGRVAVRRLGVQRASRSLVPLIRYLRDEKPDLLLTRQVHANFVGLAATMVARMPLGWRGKLVVVQDHPIELSHASNWRDNKWLAKAMYRYADGLISPSPAVLESAITWCSLNPASTALVPNPIPAYSGTPSAPPHPWLEPGEPPVFVHTSNMTRWKRLDLLIEAFADLREGYDARLLIAGDGPGRAEAAARITALRLEDCAEIVGWVEDPLEYAALGCAFVLASDEEGFGQVLTEAMSVGCPVIATDAHGGGPRFVTNDGQCGMLVPRGDRARLTEAMACMLRPDVRSKYSCVGRQRAQELSPAACGEALIEFLGKRLGIAL